MHSYKHNRGAGGDGMCWGGGEARGRSIGEKGDIYSTLCNTLNNKKKKSKKFTTVDHAHLSGHFSNLS